MDAFSTNWVRTRITDSVNTLCNVFCTIGEMLLKGAVLQTEELQMLERIATMFWCSKPFWIQLLSKYDVSKYPKLQEEKNRLAETERKERVAYKTIIGLVLENKVAADVREYVLKPYL